MAPVTIRNIRAFLLCPEGQNLVVVKVETSEPDLYGYGCATFAYRAFAVKDVIERSFRPLLTGRDVSRIEDLWKLMMVNGYWRNGPIVNNAVSGIDMALWDIKGKMAGMPLYDLWGGKCRDRVDVYRHCNAGTKEQVLELAHRAYESGCRYIRAAYTGYDGPSCSGYICLDNKCKVYDPKQHRKNTLDLFETLRREFGDSVELMTDTHERIDPADAVKLAKALEPLDMFFMEDPLSPENAGWLERIREQCTTPIAWGEVFSHPHEWTEIIQKRLVDFIRCHVSAVGGLTQARKIASFTEVYGVKTAWHGPLDMSPVGMAAQVHLDYASPNFGIQEMYTDSELSHELFPGSPEYRDGAVWLHEAPGHGVGFNEKLAEKYPPHEKHTQWTEMRLPDGTLHTP